MIAEVAASTARTAPRDISARIATPMASGLYIAVDFKPRLGGVAEHTHQMAKHLTELGEHITVVTPTLPGGAEFDQTCEYPIVRFDTKLALGSWLKSRLDRRLMLIGTLRVARRTKAEYLVCDRWSPIAGLNAVLASKLLKIPLILFAYGSEFSQPARFKFSRLVTVRAASRVACVSSYIRAYVLDDGVDPEKVVTIHNGSDLREIDAYQGRGYAGRFPALDAAFPPGRPTLLTVSRLMDRKGIDRVIEAMPTIVRKVPGTRYAVVGDGGDRERVHNLASKSPVRGSITFLGPLTGDKKFECYSRCDVFVLPAREDGFPVVVPEANAFGKPVVGGRSGGIPEAITHGENGLLVDPDSVDEIADAITRLLKNPTEARRLGLNGRRRVENEFTWKASAEALLSVARDAIARPKPTNP